jgi:ABC-2 type transport system permease protein
MSRRFWVLVAKFLRESRATIIICAVALFLFGWTGVWITALSEARFQEVIQEMASQVGEANAEGSDAGASKSEGESKSGSFVREGMQQRAAFLRSLAGNGGEINSAVIEMQFWMHPFVWLPIIVWSIGRGTLAVAGEVERGTMDLVLSRPMTRLSYWNAQVVAALIGILLIPAALLAGHWLGTSLNKLAQPPSLDVIMRPAISQAALGFAVFGVSILLSSVDRVRWRPIMIATTYIIASFAAFIVSVAPVLPEKPWKPILSNVSMFTCYNPIEAVSNVDGWRNHVFILCGIGLGATILGAIAFRGRDLPTNS